MEFRHRDYASERNAYKISRLSTDHHPLVTSSELQPSQSNEAMPLKENGAANDPLRMGRSGLPLASSGDDSATIFNRNRAPAGDWNAFKRFLMQKFPVSKMISLSSYSSSIIKSVKSIITDDERKLGTSDKEEKNAIVREDYLSELSFLKNEINRTWLAEDRAEALKLSIKVAKLLMDTSSLQFYPTLFILATEVMDKLGEMVWDRIHDKAKFSESGTIMESVSDDFRANDVNSDAKEICYYWFCKIGSIRDLLPRIYLELAILPCWRFLNDQPMQNVERLIRMARGIADPVASAYCRLYLVHCSRKLYMLDSNKEHLVICINDMNLVLAQFLAKTDFNIPFCERKRLFVSLVDPTIEYVMKCIFENSTESEADKMLEEIGLKNVSDERVAPQCLSVVLHHLLKELPCSVIQKNALKILRLVQLTDDDPFNKCMNFKLLGLRISESKDNFEDINMYFNKAMEIIEKFEDLDSYVVVVDVVFDLILQYEKDQMLIVILEGLLSRVIAVNKIAHIESENLQCILLKLLAHLKTLDRVCALVPFFELFNHLQGAYQATVILRFLEIASRNTFELGSKKLKLTFELARRLCNDSSYFNMTCDSRQNLLPLISRILCMVRYGTNLELQLKFLIDCREAFESFNEVKEILVHSCNHLAIKAVADSERKHTFIKSCIAFSEVTIPSIRGRVKQLNLYTETAEVSLICGLSGFVDGLITSAICDLETPDGASANVDTDLLFSGLLKLSSLLLIVPGDNVRKFHKAILSYVESQSIKNIEMKIKLLCGQLRLLAALSQDTLPYFVPSFNVICNDNLFYGHATFVDDLASLSSKVLEIMFQQIERISSKKSRGMIALESCNCIMSCFKNNQTMEAICEKLISIATVCLSTNDKFLLFTVKSFRGS